MLNTYRFQGYADSIKGHIINFRCKNPKLNTQAFNSITVLEDWLKATLLQLKYYCGIYNIHYDKVYEGIVYNLLDKYVERLSEVGIWDIEYYTEEFINKCSIQPILYADFFRTLRIVEKNGDEDDREFHDRELIERCITVGKDNTLNTYFAPTDWRGSLESFLTDLEIDCEATKDTFKDFVPKGEPVDMILSYNVWLRERHITNSPLAPEWTEITEKNTIYIVFKSVNPELSVCTNDEYLSSRGIKDDSVNIIKQIFLLRSNMPYHNNCLRFILAMRVYVTQVLAKSIRQPIHDVHTLSQLLPAPQYVTADNFFKERKVLMNDETMHSKKTGSIMAANSKSFAWLNKDNAKELGLCVTNRTTFSIGEMNQQEDYLYLHPTKLSEPLWLFTEVKTYRKVETDTQPTLKLIDTKHEWYIITP